MTKHPDLSLPDMQLGLFDEPVPIFYQHDWRVHETTIETARRWVTDWHYTHRMAGAGTRVWSVTAPCELPSIGSSRATIAVIMLSLPNNQAGVAGRIGIDTDVWPGNMEISRVIAHPSAPTSIVDGDGREHSGNTVSRAITMVLPIWRALGYTWVFSYADIGQNHHGGIYQALNAIYVGIGNPGGRSGWLLNGEPFHARSLVSRFGTQAYPRVIDLARKEGCTLERVEDMETEKHTYIIPLVRKRERRAFEREIEPFRLPYPKRETHHGRIPATQTATEPYSAAAPTQA